MYRKISKNWAGLAVRLRHSNHHPPAATGNKVFSLSRTSRSLQPPGRDLDWFSFWRARSIATLPTLNEDPQRRLQVLIRMPKDRSLGRNVHIYSAHDTSTVIGGLVATRGMTNSNFYSMVEITYILDKDYKLRYESGTIVQRDDNPLQPGRYLICTAGSLMTNNEPWLARRGNGRPKIYTTTFRDAVRERDRRCVITGHRAVNAAYGFWGGFCATHIFPPEYAEHWADSGHDPPTTTSTSRRSAMRRGIGVYSVQNGILLRADVRERFERYLVSINPNVSTQVCSSEFQPLTIFLGQLQDRLLRAR